MKSNANVTHHFKSCTMNSGCLLTDYEYQSFWSVYEVKSVMDPPIQHPIVSFGEFDIHISET